MVVSGRKMIISLVSLLLSLGIVVLLAKTLSPTIEKIVISHDLPKTLVGVIIAAVILLPEGIAAINAARKNKPQTSLNLALGSALASIGLTIPCVSIVSTLYDMNIILGLDIKSMILLGLCGIHGNAVTRQRADEYCVWSGTAGEPGSVYISDH